MSKQRNISIGVGVFVLHPEDGKILVTRRRNGSSSGVGRLALPGGKIEEFELLMDCAIREVKEETGLEVRLIVMGGLNGYTYVMHAEEWFREKRHQWTIYVVAEIRGGVLANPEPHKHEDWRWMNIEELEQICTYQDWIPMKALRAHRKEFGL